METLLELAPRDAGVDPGEPDVDFVGGRSMHEVDACVPTCVCIGNTNTCPGTGHSSEV